MRGTLYHVSLPVVLFDKDLIELSNLAKALAPEVIDVCIKFQFKVISGKYYNYLEDINQF